jgi:two-component system, NarL family, response regulator YdfI
LESKLDLSPRQVTTLWLLADGLTTKEMAEKLGVCDKTVKTHLTRLFVKLGAASRTHSVAIAFRKGILK